MISGAATSRAAEYPLSGSVAALTPGEQARLPGEGRWAVLAALRFLLAFDVLAAHVSSYARLTGPLHLFRQIGDEVGVLGFFVVSGYSIAHSITTRPAGFLKRRLDRLYPSYLAGLLLACVPTALGLAQAPDNLWQFVAQFAFLQGLLAPTLMANIPMWSLGCEAIYHLAAPLLRRAGGRTLLALALASALLYGFRYNLPFIGSTSMPGQIHGNAAICLYWAWLMGYAAYRYEGAKWLAPCL